MESYIKTLQDSKLNDIKTITTLITNTIKTKALYLEGGWSLVRSELKENEHFNPNFVINVGGICAKLRELGYKNTISVQNNMSEIERYVNKTLGVKAIEYRIDRKHHFFSIILG